MAVLDGLKYVLQRNKQYFQHHKINYFLFALLLVVNLGLAFLLFKQWKPVVKPAYIVTDPLGNVLWSCPLNGVYAAGTQKKYCNSKITPEDVKTFAAKGLRSAWALDYQNYASQMTAASRYYTKTGWAAFAGPFTQQNLGVVTGKKGNTPKILSPETSDVQIVDSGLNEKTGRYTWKVSMNLNIPQLIAGNKPFNYVYQVIVQREPVENYPKRLAIVSSTPSSA
jgi:hypothetical protein